MKLTEKEIIQTYGQHCMHCTKDTLQPYEDEYSCVACGIIIARTKNQLLQIQRKKIYFTNRLKYAEKEMFLYRRIKNI